MPRAVHVLLVDRPGWPRDLVEGALRRAGLIVDAVTAAEDLPDALHRTSPDCVLLSADGELPAASQRALCRHARPRVVAFETEGKTRYYEMRLEPTAALGPLNADEIAGMIAARCG